MRRNFRFGFSFIRGLGLEFFTRPGLFSLATLYNGYTDTMEKMLERLRMDLEYMEKATFWLDMKIITLTGISILTGKKF